MRGMFSRESHGVGMSSEVDAVEHGGSPEAADELSRQQHVRGSLAVSSFPSLPSSGQVQSADVSCTYII